MKKRKNSRASDLLIQLESAPFQYQEAMNSLRTNLKFISSVGNCKRIIITSAIPNEGKSSVAINLSESLAMAGNKVLLIDCDLRRPVVHRYLKIKNGKTIGLTSIFRGDGNIGEKIHAIKENFFVLASGAIPPNPAELLGGAMMGEFIRELSQSFDYMVLDTPPILMVTDAAELSQHTDGVIMVIRQKLTTYQQAKQAKMNLEAVNAKILGVVLNDFDLKETDNRSGYYYSYYYQYGENK